MDIKKINVSEAFHQKIGEETKRLKMSKKAYLEAATQFFIARKIDPREYDPGQVQDIAVLLQEAVDRLFGYLVFQEKYILKPLLIEIIKARVLSEIAVNNLLAVSNLSDEEFTQIQKQNDRYFEDKLRQVMESYEKEKVEAKPSNR